VKGPLATNGESPARERELTKFIMACLFLGVDAVPSISREVLMRILALAIFGMLSIGPAMAQTYDPAYPVCLHVYSQGANYYQCRYTSLPQCNASASGRAAECVINPYFANGEGPGKRYYRRHPRVY
jgi:Protein of unknown function (DUF3551)